MAKDIRRLSKEKHEIRYAKRIAEQELKKISKEKYSDYTGINVGRLKRICRILITLYNKNKKLWLLDNKYPKRE